LGLFAGLDDVVGGEVEAVRAGADEDVGVSAVDDVAGGEGVGGGVSGGAAAEGFEEEGVVDGEWVVGASIPVGKLGAGLSWMTKMPSKVASTSLVEVQEPKMLTMLRRAPFMISGTAR
jgi:hypothetical protein